MELESVEILKFQPSKEVFSDEFSELISREPLSVTSFAANAVIHREMDEMEDGVSLKSLIRSVYDALESAERCRVVDFNPSGCKWRAILAYEDEVEDEVLSALMSAEDKMDTHYCLYAACCEKLGDRSPFPEYSIDIALMPPRIEPSFIPPQLKVIQKEIGRTFEDICYAVKKAVVKLELPKFPQGSSGKMFKDVYRMEKEINAGSYAKVFRAVHRETKEVVAVKAIVRNQISPGEDASIMNEVSILSTLDHPQIIKLIDFFEEPDWYLIVMEFMAGGDLFDKIGNTSSYNEDDARNVSITLLKAVNYCHQNGVAHLDLKAKNLLLKDTGDVINVKLGDFGFATRVTGPNCLNTQCGTPFYVAPEIIRCKPYDERADMWSLGVIIYLILSGELPFMAKSAPQLFRKVLKCDFHFSRESWTNVSDEAKDVIKHLLVTDPEQRWTASQALKSPWLAIDRKTLAHNDLRHSATRLKCLNAAMTFRAAVLAVTWINRLNPYQVAPRGSVLFSLESVEILQDEDSGTESDNNH